LFHRLLDAVLKTGNHIYLGTHFGDAKTFKLGTLLKLADIKSNDGKTTLLHFIVREVIKTEKLVPQFINSLESGLSTVKKASSIDPDELRQAVSKLGNGIEKVRNVIRLNQPFVHNGRGLGLNDAMTFFLQRAELEILEVQEQENVALYSVIDVAKFFHGDSASEESEPFRIFTVVRDFLVILNSKICKDTDE
jgi:Formin Homology 2 Domain